MIAVVCAHCGKLTDKAAGHVNRTRAVGGKLFCDRACFGLDRRKHKTVTAKRAEKREYDAEYRQRNRAMLKEKKADYFRRTYDADVARAYRKARMGLHVAYCQREEYKRWKSDYDRRYRAREYGDFADAFMLVLDIDNEVDARMSDYEVRMANGTINKAMQRRREHARTFGREPQAGAVGNAQRDQE